MTAVKNLATDLFFDIIAAFFVVAASIAALLVLLFAMPLRLLIESAASKRSGFCKKCFDSSQPEGAFGFVFKPKTGRQTCTNCGSEFYAK